MGLKFRPPKSILGGEGISGFKKNHIRYHLNKMTGKFFIPTADKIFFLFFYYNTAISSDFSVNLLYYYIIQDPV